MNLNKTLFIILVFASGVIFGLYINLFTKEPEPEKIVLNQEIVCKNLEELFKYNQKNMKSTKQIEKDAAINRMLRN